MRKIITILLLAVTLIIAGCGEEKAKSETNVNGVKLDTMSYDALDRIKKDHAGKVILVNFFASWCPPCRGETPEFVKVYNANKDRGFVIVGLSVDEKMSDAVKYIDDFGVKYPVYMADASLQQKYGISTIPMNFIYSPDGQMIDLITGPVSEKHLITVIEKYSSDK